MKSGGRSCGKLLNNETTLNFIKFNPDKTFQSSIEFLDTFLIMEASTRNMLVSFFSGTIFAIGWWVFVAAWDNQTGAVFTALNSTSTASNPFNETLYNEIVTGYYNPLWAICSLATIGLIMVNTVGNEVVTGDGFGGVEGATCLARMYVFTGFLLLFSTLISSIWVMTEYVGKNGQAGPDFKTSGTGWSLMIQNLFIFFSACVFKFGRDESAWGGF